MKKIVFISQPSTAKFVGDFNIYLQWADYISKLNVYEVHFVSPQLPKEIITPYLESKISIHNNDDCDFSEFEDAIILTPINQIMKLLGQIKKIRNAKLCFHFAHPQISNWLFNQFPHESLNKHNLLQLFCDENAYCFMDGANYLAIINNYSIAFQKYYLPAPLPNEVANILDYPQELIKKDTISVGWLGRLDRDKIFSIINLADRLFEADIVTKIDFHIIGDGNAKNLINISHYSPKIRFIFTSSLFGDILHKYIIENIDLMLAMGVSALLSGSLLVPTIIPIVSPTRYHDNRFVYLFDLQEYALGWSQDDLKKLGCTTHTIEEVINDIYDDGNKAIFGIKCREFCKKTFSIDYSVKKCLQALERTTLTVDKCLNNPSIKKQMESYHHYLMSGKGDNYSQYCSYVASRNKKPFKNAFISNNLSSLFMKRFKSVYKFIREI